MDYYTENPQDFKKGKKSDISLRTIRNYAIIGLVLFITYTGLAGYAGYERAKANKELHLKNQKKAKLQAKKAAKANSAEVSTEVITTLNANEVTMPQMSEKDDVWSQEYMRMYSHFTSDHKLRASIGLNDTTLDFRVRFRLSQIVSAYYTALFMRQNHSLKFAKIVADKPYQKMPPSQQIATTMIALATNKQFQSVRLTPTTISSTLKYNKTGKLSDKLEELVRKYNALPRLTKNSRQSKDMRLSHTASTILFLAATTDLFNYNLQKKIPKESIQETLLTLMKNGKSIGSMLQKSQNVSTDISASGSAREEKNSTFEKDTSTRAQVKKFFLNPVSMLDFYLN